jgi:hypothetical protein
MCARKRRCRDKMLSKVNISRAYKEDIYFRKLEVDFNEADEIEKLLYTF